MLRSLCHNSHASIAERNSRPDRGFYLHLCMLKPLNCHPCEKPISQQLTGAQSELCWDHCFDYIIKVDSVENALQRIMQASAERDFILFPTCWEQFAVSVVLSPQRRTNQPSLKWDSDFCLMEAVPSDHSCHELAA